MKYLIILFTLISCVPVAFADLPYDPKFSLEPPTTFTDGSPLTPALDLEGYVLDCTGADTVLMLMPPDVTTWQPLAGTFTVAGSYTCVARCRATAENGGEESVDSSPVNFTVLEKAPKSIVTFGVE